jgi:hypothetical protein
MRRKRKRNPTTIPKRKNFIRSTLWSISGHSPGFHGIYLMMSGRVHTCIYLTGKDPVNKYNRLCIFDGKILYFGSESKIS